MIRKKKALYILFLWGISAGCTLTLISCGTSTEPDIEQRLVIEDGLYKNVGTDSLGEVRYAIEFVYYVEGEECEVGGFSVTYSDHVTTAIWYRKQLLKPGKKYTITHTLGTDSLLNKAPVVSMQGYKVGSSESHEGLTADYVLHTK